MSDNDELEKEKTYVHQSRIQARMSFCKFPRLFVLKKMFLGSKVPQTNCPGEMVLSHMVFHKKCPFNKESIKLIENVKNNVYSIRTV
jgi:hypothetical protein